jgi:hypothetical protein
MPKGLAPVQALRSREETMNNRISSAPSTLPRTGLAATRLDEAGVAVAGLELPVAVARKTR